MKFLCSAWFGVSKNKFPVTNVYPSVKLPADLFEMCNFFKSHFLMKCDTSRVWQSHSSDHSVQRA